MQTPTWNKQNLQYGAVNPTISESHIDNFIINFINFFVISEAQGLTAFCATNNNLQIISKLK